MDILSLKNPITDRCFICELNCFAWSDPVRNGSIQSIDPIHHSLNATQNDARISMAESNGVVTHYQLIVLSRWVHLFLRLFHCKAQGARHDVPLALVLVFIPRSSSNWPNHPAP